MVDIKKRIFYFKGKSEDELKNLSETEILGIIGARGRRSLKRGLNQAKKELMRNVATANKMVLAEKKYKLKTHARDAIIVPAMLGLRIEVHSGKSFEPVIIKQEMIGHYLGEFALTRKRTKHSGGKK